METLSESVTRQNHQSMDISTGHDGMSGEVRAFSVNYVGVAIHCDAAPLPLLIGLIDICLAVRRGRGGC